MVVTGNHGSNCIAVAVKVRSTILKPDQHRDGGDEHDEIAGSKHVRRDRQRHCKQGWWIHIFVSGANVRQTTNLMSKTKKYRYFSKISETWEWGITESWLADRLLCPITIVYHCMPYQGIQLYTIVYYAIPSHTIVYHTVRCHIMSYNTTLHHTVHHIEIPYQEIPWNAIPYHEISRNAIPYPTITCVTNYQS